MQAHYTPKHIRAAPHLKTICWADVCKWNIRPIKRGCITCKGCYLLSHISYQTAMEGDWQECWFVFLKQTRTADECYQSERLALTGVNEKQWGILIEICSPRRQRNDKNRLQLHGSRPLNSTSIQSELLKRKNPRIVAYSHYVIATVTGSSGSAGHALDPRPPFPLAVEINNLFKCKQTSVIAVDETQQLRCSFFFISYLFMFKGVIRLPLTL